MEQFGSITGKLFHILKNALLKCRPQNVFQFIGVECEMKSVFFENDLKVRKTVNDSKVLACPSNLFNMKYIVFIVRVQVKGPCSMDFSSFPMDHQLCYLTLESFSYNNKEVSVFLNYFPFSENN